ncbi:CDP-alcohol phosphatidyltransferase family protein [Nannocystis sp.]|uniref:CDP-alcohol phosphatidyltransferase family protein n=1 Tax=Nannocystis sp. TaxID=1962667 RepID=UPI002427F992|nr:CDP-alcohol phosphatidyltransferase family protein [Nannocystis sp.]MBK7828784.1 CDP-alcohol phosphatidyltransferase family protein [Nannocystis sp.]MBK9753921.1 CDP-alcohol phosphatidyltransferase family protein [Nannocystis sp.]
MASDEAPHPIPPRAEDTAWSYGRTLKDPSTEELVDLYLHRPLAYLLLRPLEHAAWRPTPNQFTLAGGAIGLFGAALILVAPLGSWLWPLAACLLFFANILDCVDGMLARLTGQGSARGMLLDGMIDFIIGVAFWLAMSIRTAPDWGVWTVPAALSIVLSVLIHTGLYDHMRLRYGVLVSPPRSQATASRPHAEAEDAAPRGLRTRMQDAFFAFAQGFYEVTYTNISRICIGVEPSSPRPAVHPEFARQLFAGPMRMATYLGLGTHLLLMFIGTATAIVHLHLPFYIALGVVVGLLNLWAVLVVVAWRRAEALIAELREA